MIEWDGVILKTKNMELGEAEADILLAFDGKAVDISLAY